MTNICDAMFVNGSRNSFAYQRNDCTRLRTEALAARSIQYTRVHSQVTLSSERKIKIHQVKYKVPVLSSSSVEVLDTEKTSSERRFHINRLAATDTRELSNLKVSIRLPESFEELDHIALLRARSFYVFPPERAFSGKLMVEMKAGEESERLRGLRQGAMEGGETVTPLLATASVLDLQHAGGAPDNAGVSPLLTRQGQEEVVGSLDVFLRGSSPPDSAILRGNVDAGAYMANVCVSPSALRRGVARQLVAAAQDYARTQGAPVLYVITLAVNEKAGGLYRNCGFVVEKEESANAAKGRGGCLDGIEGRANVVLFKCTL